MRITTIWFIKSTTQIVTQNWILWTGSCMRSVLENQDPTLLFNDEAWFNLSGYVNSQNKKFWPVENSMLFYDVPWHKDKIRVWCPMLSWKYTSTPTRYTHHNTIFDHLSCYERNHVLLSQTVQKPHTVSKPMRFNIFIINGVLNV